MEDADEGCRYINRQKIELTPFVDLNKKLSCEFNLSLLRFSVVNILQNSAFAFFPKQFSARIFKAI
jgi:hypothetical protein